MPYKNVADQRACAARHHQRNRVAIAAMRVAYRKQLRATNKAYVDLYKTEHGCARCPVCDPRCLDFHHLGNKCMAIAALLGAWSLERLKTEIAKCIVLCANCHRIETAEARERGTTHFSGDGCTTHS